jgi:hypothetical protein
MFGRLPLRAFSLALLLLNGLAVTSETGVLDKITLGDSTSEKLHSYVDAGSQAGKGGLGQPMRQLLPLEPPAWKGTSLSFSLKADPSQLNYVTVRFWGNDVTDDRLVLFCEGKQVGWYHLGPVEMLDGGNTDGTPQFNDRFFYHTSPLPLSLTKGKDRLSFEIRAMGRIWGYGKTWDEYQKNMTAPSRGIYAVYTHTDGCFVPPADELQGSVAANPPIRSAPGAEVIDDVKARVNAEIEKEISGSSPLSEIQMQFLAHAYFVKWCQGYRNPKLVQRVVNGLDALCELWLGAPEYSLTHPPGAYNPDWLAFGPAGDAIRLLGAPLQPYLDQPVRGGTRMRREAWSKMLQSSRDYSRTHRRLYSNQSLIVDLNGYRANRGVEAIDPKNALPESHMLDYLNQSLGLTPWLGSDTDHGPEKPMGDHYYELTPKGLTKELGFVGYYGEVIDWATQIYDATCAVTEEGMGQGNEAIRKRVAEIARARAFFRAPGLDELGNRAMRIETIVGWRDEGHFPGSITYAERPTWDAGTLYVVAKTLDSALLGYAQEMFADNQFYNTLERTMASDKGLRTTVALLAIPDELDLVKSQPTSRLSLPMSPGMPDFAWADEQDGVVAVKHGSDVFYASVYWRANFGINSLARIHYTTPAFDRIAVVHEDEEFEPSGLTYTYPDWVNFGFGNGGIKYPDDLHQAMAGETIPIAKPPEGVTIKTGSDNPYAGRADFYYCRYGDYVIEMNSSAGKPHPLRIPEDATMKQVPDLISGKPIALDATSSIPPNTTLVLYLSSAAPAVSQP